MSALLDVSLPHLESESSIAQHGATIQLPTSKVEHRHPRNVEGDRSNGENDGSDDGEQRILVPPARSRMIPSPEEESEDPRLLRIAAAVRTILENLGEDPERQGLRKTPMRYAKALAFLTQGYETSLVDILNDAIFDEDCNEMVVIRNIDISSLCEHHLVPFTGKLHVGYIPNKKVLGLSKFVRIAETFCRRLQVQERLTKEISQALHQVLLPQGVGVVIECSHMCMVMRGVEKPGATTITCSVLGSFADPRIRQEFMTMVRGKD